MIAPTYKGSPVPWTTPWSGEEADYEIRREHYLGGHWAICQRSAPGSGIPRFTTAHYQRQRQAIVQGRCDVCGRLIGKGSARILLARGEPLKGTGEIGHVMAPSHRSCARLAAMTCPWILKQIETGELTVTVPKKTRVALAFLDPEIVEAEIGRRVAVPVVGHAKLIVDSSMTRDAEWLMRDVAALQS